jgi:hypothetical protein
LIYINIAIRLLWRYQSYICSGKDTGTSGTNFQVARYLDARQGSGDDLYQNAMKSTTDVKPKLAEH